MKYNFMTQQISIAENRDCLEYMRGLADNFADLAIVDPPYSNSTDAINKVDCVNLNKQASVRTQYKKVEWNNCPDKNYFDELFRVSKNQIIWGGNFFGLSGGYICWNKNGTAFGECELAYCSMINSVRLYEFTWNGMVQGNMKNKERRIHPTQKPTELYRWLLKTYAKPGDKILDTHGGSFSSRIACWDLGFDFYGCELDRDYFDAAEERFQRHIAQPTFWETEKEKAEQTSLFASA